MNREDTQKSGIYLQAWIKVLIKTFVPPPRSVVDVSQRRRAQLVAASSLAVSVYLLAGLILGPNSLRAQAALLIVSIPSYVLTRTRYHGAASLLFTFGGLVYTYLSINLGSTPNLETAVIPMGILWLIVAGAILTPTGLFIYYLTATILTFTSPMYAAPPAINGSSTRLGWLVVSISTILYALRLYREFASDARLHQLEDENQKLERARLDLELHLGVQTIDLNDRTQEMGIRLADLESTKHRLENQASQLDVFSKLINTLITFRAGNESLTNITTMLSQHFDFNHVGIYLVDEQREFAVLRAANGDAGQRMLDRKHQVRIGEDGIVGVVSATHQTRIVPDPDSNPTYSMDPELTDTSSEIALPIMSIKSGQILGVLDVHSTQNDTFDEHVRRFLELLAGNIGLAIEGSLLHESSQRLPDETASPGHQQSQAEEWDRFKDEQRLVGYRYDITGASPLTRPISLTDQTPDQAGGITDDYINMPIELRGEVLGELLVHAPAGKKWNQDELDLIKAVAERVALSAENARLFEETTRRAERERMVSEITSKIRSTNDPNEMIKKAIQELKIALGVSRVEVRPQKASSDSNVFEA